MSYSELRKKEIYVHTILQFISSKRLSKSKINKVCVTVMRSCVNIKSENIKLCIESYI